MPEDNIIIRKNIISLSENEKKHFIEAVLALKQNTRDAVVADNRYDDYVLMHAKTMSQPSGTDSSHRMRNLAHRSPIFLPWHREYLIRFEQDLRKEVSDVAIPYWDWTDNRRPDTFQILWADDFMGGDGDPDNDDIVGNGPFKDWFTVEADDHTGNPIGRSRLRRRFGEETRQLPSLRDVYNAFQYDFYDTPYWDTSSQGFRNILEGWINPPGLHNRVHVWVGGSMLINTSPNDPVFFLNHCNVDRIWAIWQHLRFNDGYPANGTIVDRNCSTLRGINKDDVMYPWDIEPNGPTVNSVLEYRKLKYRYEHLF